MDRHIVFDDNGKKYIIKNLENFKEHIIKYHTIDGKPDNSLHVENGRSFRVTDDFFKNLMRQ